MPAPRPSAFGTGTFSRLNDLLPGLRKARGIHEPSLGERRVPYGRDHERHFPDRGRAFHFDWNALKGARDVASGTSVIGTFRTCRDVRFESAFAGRAEVGI